MSAKKHCEVVFQPDSLRAEVPEGTPLGEIMRSLRVRVPFPCGGTGTCGKCRVEITPDAPPPTDVERGHLTDEEIERGVRLACRVTVDRAMTVRPESGLSADGARILVDGAARIFDLNPIVEKRFVHLGEPVDGTSHVSRLVHALGDDALTVDVELLRVLPSLLLESDHAVTAVITDGRVTDIEMGDTSGLLYGMAFDIGTTTVVGTLFDLRDGTELAHASRLNPQVMYGEDTISRITHVIDNHDGETELAERVIGAVNEIVDEVAQAAEISPATIYEVVFAGNTVMMHLLVGLDPSGLGSLPFVPVTVGTVDFDASSLGLYINSRAEVYILPGVAGFVGADTTAVMLASDYQLPGPTRLAIDVGTNGELALRYGDKISVCSTAAGPALEGAALTCGMRAAQGAVEHVRITEGLLDMDVIDQTGPMGVCGSGIVDLVAVLLDCGVLDPSGAFCTGDELPLELGDDLRGRVVMHEDEPAFVVTHASESGVARDIILTQRDVRKIQLAKGAIAAGIVMLCKSMGITVNDLDEVLLAGAFGSYIDRQSALRIGLLPAIPAKRVHIVGNAASTGAKMALLSRDARHDAEVLAASVDHVELAADPEFMDAMADAMIFPESMP